MHESDFWCMIITSGERPEASVLDFRALVIILVMDAVLVRQTGRVWVYEPVSTRRLGGSSFHAVL